jgi:thiol-disulfide isomerase/thioredoxin/YHS domain-containing protein
MRPPGIAIGVLTAIGFGMSLLAANPVSSTVWRHDFSAAQAESRKLDRPLLIHFSASWCGPCRRMEREVLLTPDVLRTLDNGYVAVKVDVEKNRNIAQRYHIQALPSDVIVSPEGRVLSQSQGFQDKGSYLSSVNRVRARYVATRKPATPEPPLATRKPALPATSDDNAIASIGTAAAGLAQLPDEAPADTDLDKQPAAAEEPEASTADSSESTGPVGMDGYCPVTLFKTRSWQRGLKEYRYEFRGQVFHLLGPEQLEAFKANPQKYAPQLLGCDPVILLEEDLAVSGRTQFGAYYEGELYLFESAQSRSRFRANPTRFNRTRQILKVEDITTHRA